jgi:hypothetical protein
MDAMAIHPSIHYIEKSDKIKGYEDTGDGSHSSEVADQTLVLSIRGLHRHWKQVLSRLCVKIYFMECYHTRDTKRTLCKLIF